MESMRKETLVLAAAIVIAAWLVGEGLRGPRYVQAGDDVRVMLDTRTGTAYVMPRDGGQWVIKCKVP